MTKELHSTIGHHYIVEASGCDPKIIGSVEKVQQILVKAAEIAGSHVWAISFSKFPPNGVSGVVVISESHISTHTWPEMRYGALDIYTCGNSGDPEKAVIYAVEAFAPGFSRMSASSSEAMLLVIIMIVFAKETVFPLPSVNLPSSMVCRSTL